MRGLLLGLIPLVLVPIAISAGVSFYYSWQFQSWTTGPSQYYWEIKAVVDRYPAEFDETQRDAISKYKVTADIVSKAISLQKPRVLFNIEVFLLVSVTVYIALAVLNKLSETPRVTSGDKDYDTKKVNLDIGTSKILLFGGAPGGALSGFLLTAYEGMATMPGTVFSILMFFQSFVLGLLARSAISRGIKPSTSEKKTKLNVQLYLTFWWLVVYQLFSWIIGLATLLLSVLML